MNVRLSSVLLALPALLAACGGGGKEPAVRDLLLITLDTTRADALTGEGLSAEIAPRITALGENGVRFTRAWTVVPLTLPSHASILTGLYPPRHGIRDNGHASLPPDVETLAERLRARGYDTGAFVSTVVLDRGFGLDQGFDVYDQPELQGTTYGHRLAMRNGAVTAEAAARWVAGRGERPFFLWLHLYDAHAPYVPEPGHLARAGGDPYLGEVAATDDAVGVVLDALAAAGRKDTTLVVVTADHGESLGEHGEPTHGALCYEGTMRVPLLLHFPHEPPEPGPTRLVSVVDLVPTLLGRLGVAVEPGLDGFDLFAPDAPRERGLYMECFSGYMHLGWSPLAGWLDADGKYLHSSRPELYLPLQDPGELNDLAASRPRECEAARTRIAELLARPRFVAREAQATAELSRAMAALGYARGEDFGAMPSPLEPSDRPSPAQRKHVLEPLDLAQAYLDAGRYAQCRPLVEGILRGNPDNPMALDFLALCQMYDGEFPEARATLEHRVALAPTADALLNLGLCFLELGDPEAALPQIDAALALVPDHPEVQAARERAQQQLGER